jgi:beta-barrel assembly-enhancing protease
MKAITAAVFAFLLAGGILASIGKQDKTVDLSSAREIWADVLRDADQIGLQVTRMPVADEIQLGQELSAGMQSWEPEDPADTQYVTAVAASLIPHLRRQEIPYRFHVIESASINAFALPGGQIYILRGMMNFLRNEAELAAILGHEMAHVDLRHCVERYQYQHALKRAGAGDVGQAIDMARILVTLGYNQFQELDADAEGARLAIDAGYDPEAAEAVFSRLEKVFGESARPRATTPAGEVTAAMDEALMDYFRTHPRSAERARRMHALAASHPELNNRAFFVGKQNYATRTPRSKYAPPTEMRTLTF